MKTVWIASLAIMASPYGVAQSTTIYKHVDESGRITYTNKPMKGAVAMDLEPINTLPVPVAVSAATVRLSPPAEKAPEPAKLAVVQKPEPVAKVEPLPRMESRTASAMALSPQALASVEPSLQRRRDDERRRILEGELKQEEGSLEKIRASLHKEQQNPTLVAAVRAAQTASDPTPAQMAEFRANIDKVSGRIRGLQSTVADHEKNIEALKKELGALKP